MSRRRVLIVTAVLLLLFAALPAVLIYYAAFTPEGLQFIVRHVPKRIGRAQLTIANPRGSLARGFEIARIEIDHERSHLIFEGIKGRLAIAPLLWQTIEAREVTLRRVFIEVRPRTRPSSSYTPRFLPAGLSIRVDRARADTATLIATNGRRFDVSRLETSGVVQYRTLRLFDASFDWESMHIGGRADLRAADPMQVNGDARITISWPGQPVWTIDATGRGDLQTLPLEAHFTTPFRADFIGSAMDLTGAWHWGGDARIHDFDLRAWGGGAALGRITGSLEVSGDARGFAARGPLTPAGLAVGAFETVFAGSYADRIVTASRIELSHPSGAFLQGSGTIGIVTDGPRLDLHGAWRNFRWPLVGKKIAVRSASGDYALSGVWPYNWRAKGPFVVRELAPMPVQGEGRLAKDRAYLDSVAIEAFEGKADLSGEVTWTPADTWAVHGRALDINPGRLRADLPGQLNFYFAVNGEGFDGEGDYAVTVRNINGKLRKVTASGGGTIARRGTTWQLDDIQLSLGGTQIAANGSIGREADLRFALDTKDLGLLKPGSRGQLHAQGTVRGTMKEPLVTATLSGGGIHHGAIALDSINAAVDFDAFNRHPSKIDVRAHNLKYNNRAFSTLSFALDGTAAAHVARVNAKTGDLAIQMQAAGAFARGAWKGQLRTLEVASPESLQLGLETPVELLASAQQVRVGSFCLHGKPARVCAAANWTPASWTASLNAKDLPLSTLTAGLTDDVEYRGAPHDNRPGHGHRQCAAAGRLARRPGGRPHRASTGERAPAKHSAGLGTGHGKRDRQRNRSAGRARGRRGRHHQGTYRACTRKRPLAGHAPAWRGAGANGRAGFCDAVCAADRSGRRTARRGPHAHGYAGTPLVDGMIRLSDAELDQYQVNLAMRGAMLEARLAGNGLDFTGSARIGKGEAHTNGRLEWRDAMPYGKFQLEGQNLRVVDVPEAQIDASPDLDFRIDGRRIEVTGTVTVPHAKIVPTDLTQCRARVLRMRCWSARGRADPRKRFEVVTAITLALGDKVSIDTFGLTARLDRQHRPAQRYG